MSNLKILLTIILVYIFINSTSGLPVSFTSNWHSQKDRVWIGPEYWANPMEDWRINNGRLECINNSSNRNVQLLTYQLNPESEMEMEVTIGQLTDSVNGWAGFEIGISSLKDDYRHNLIFGNGIKAGFNTAGFLFIDDQKVSCNLAKEETLKLSLDKTDSGHVIKLSLYQNEQEVAVIKKIYPSEAIIGNIALVSHGIKNNDFSFNPAFYFTHWRIEGHELSGNDTQNWGPILWTQYTQSRGILKLQAQFPPLGKEDLNKGVKLQLFQKDHWKDIGEATIHQLARVAMFRIENWDATKDVRYRVVYPWNDKDYYLDGIIEKDPVEKEQIKLAAFSCDNGYAFPISKLVDHVISQNPDLLFFAGDQIYEKYGGYGVYRGADVELGMLNYLRKYYMFGWTWRDILKDKPSIIIPDDHDVFQGNLWGDQGRALPINSTDWDLGGFIMPPAWINAVQMTQTGHLPDPYKPEPVQQDIEVYITDLVYGRINFAVLEDRKFKTGPKRIFSQDVLSQKDPELVNVAEAELLGERQKDFLKQWVKDWQETDMKAVLSQTIFCKANTHAGNLNLRTEWDLDNDGWPQIERNETLDILRRGFAFMIHGDQHFSIQVHHGIDDWEDAGVALMVTGTAVGFPRAWWPDHPGENQMEGKSKWTGRYRDDLGNKMTVMAVGNPDESAKGKLPKHPDEIAYIKSSGYGLVTFDKSKQTIHSQILRYGVAMDDPNKEIYYPDWPIEINMTDNYGKKAYAYLPTLKIANKMNPVVQVINQQKNNVEYTLRVNGDTFVPKVFEGGRYTIKVINDTGEIKSFKNLKPTSKPNMKEIKLK